MSTKQDFNSAYEASKPPQVQVLRYFPVEPDGTAELQISTPSINGGPTVVNADAATVAMIASLSKQFAKKNADGSYTAPTRLDVAYGLATQGAVIDPWIDARGMDPYLAMELWTAQGFTWVPNALQAGITIAPGLGVPGQASYDPANPPPGSIKVSLNLLDYPQFNPPRPVVAPPASGISPVGALLHDTMYAEQPWDKTENGDVTGQGGVPADARGRFQKVKVASAWGYMAYFTKIG